jgi:hypothetical protein
MPRTEGPECRRFRRQRKHVTARSTREEAPRLVPTPIGSRAAAFDLADDDDATDVPVPARTHEPTDQPPADPQPKRSRERWHDQMPPRHVAPSTSAVHCTDRRARARIRRKRRAASLCSATQCVSPRPLHGEGSGACVPAPHATAMPRAARESSKQSAAERNTTRHESERWKREGSAHCCCPEWIPAGTVRPPARVRRRTPLRCHCSRKSSGCPRRCTRARKNIKQQLGWH